MRAPPIPSALSAALLTAGFAAAQCPITSLAAATYGQGCNPVFAAQPPAVNGALTSTCTLDVTVDGFGGCCNTFPVGQLLVLGTTPAQVPLPQFGSGCELLVAPDVIAFLPAAAGGPFSIPLAGVASPVTVYAQGSVLYFTTIGLALDFALSAGVQIDLS